MGREIKFRAWDGENLWPSSSLELHEKIGGYYIVVPLRGRINNVELGQYTGLKDKNGKEIYEGDIVRVTSLSQILDAEVAEVIWTNKYLGFGLRSICSTDPMLPHLIRDIEVIGNIHENPELLSPGAKGDRRDERFD